MRKHLAVVAVLMSLGACAGGESFDSAEELAEGANCGGFEQSESPAIFEREAGTCERGGDPVSLATFNDSEARDQWLEIAESFGGVYVVGDNWVVSVESREEAENVTELIGGDVR